MAIAHPVFPPPLVRVRPPRLELSLEELPDGTGFIAYQSDGSILLPEGVRWAWERLEAATVAHAEEIEAYNDELEELKQNCQVLHRHQTAPPTKHGHTRLRLPGYVYLLRSDNNVFKIGRSANPELRLTQIQREHGGQLSIELTIYTDDSEALEEALYAKYRKQRLHGEWFNLTADQVEEIRRLAVGGYNG